MPAVPAFRCEVGEGYCPARERKRLCNPSHLRALPDLCGRQHALLSPGKAHRRLGCLRSGNNRGQEEKTKREPPF
jgi:hypothetical protein